VSIFVGPKRKQYTVHKDLLCKAVPFFRKAFSGAFGEATMGEIYLSDENDNPAAVELFIHWLYKGAIPSVPTEGLDRVSWEIMATNGTLAMLIPYHDLYYMAEKWCASLLKNEILEEIRNFHRDTATLIHPDLIVKGFVNTSESSPLRRYLADACAFAFSIGDKPKYVSVLCDSKQDVALGNELFQKLILLGDFGGAHDPDFKPASDYHEVVKL